MIMLTAISLSIRHYLSERFRLRFEDANIDEMENETIAAASKADAGVMENWPMEMAKMEHDARADAPSAPAETGAFRTLDGELVSDEMEQDAINYQILLDKIDGLLERLKLDA